MHVLLEQYLRLVATKIEEAQAKGDYAETARLMRLLIETLQDKLGEYERSQQQPST